MPNDVDEFGLAGLTPIAGRMVAAPRVAESPVNFECRVTQTLRLQTSDARALDTWLVFGEVVAVHIDRDLIENGVYLTARAQPVVRGGGAGDYAEITEAAMFFMGRPG